MSKPSLPLHVRKAVWARALVYQVLDLHYVTLHDAGYGVLWTAIRNRLITSTSLQVEYPSCSSSLSSYLAGLGADLRAGMSYPNEEAEQACRAVLDEIYQVLTEAARTADDLLLSAFTDALRVATELYRRHGVDVPPHVEKRVTATFGHQLMPLESELPIELKAVTYLQDPPPGPSALVDVVVNAIRLDELTAFSLPYVLLHECVCHVLQGPWQAGRQQPDAGDRFAEGWMDVVAYVAHELMERPWRAGHTGPDLLAIPLDGRKDAAAEVHKSRQRSTADRAGARRALGAQAARNMQALLAKLPETRNDADAAFIQLSVRLNTSCLRNDQRELFVRGVHSATQLRPNPGLATAVRTYLDDQDVERLVRDVTKLFT
jgi:hypothetical protein